jgi:hypothetical protein
MFDHTTEKTRSTLSLAPHRIIGGPLGPAGLAVLLLALSACGGGGGGSSGSTASPAMVRGVLQSVQGGLTVNGVTFATAGAVLTTSDQSAPVTLGADDAGAHLHPGMVVTVRGRMDDSAHGEAAEVEFHDQLEGEVEVHRAGELEIEGVHVSIDDGSSGLDKHGGAVKPEDIPTGTRVAVSGHADSRGGLRATLVRERDPAAEREVRAYVAGVNGTVIDLAFAPSGPVALQVDVSGINPAPSFPVGTLVEVRTQGPASVAGVFTATAIHAEDALEGQAEDEAEVEGIVTASDPGGFTVGGQRVVTSASTTVQGGTLADVVVGVELEAEGALQSDGSLLARVLKLRPAVRVDANVDAVDPAAGTVTAIGVTIHVTPSTELRGFGALSELAVGNAVEVRGIPTSDGGVDALRIELQGTAPSDRAFLRGVVTAKTPTTGLTILGIAIDVSAAELGGPGVTTAQEFFDAITPGQTLVKVRWRPYPASTSAPVDQAEIEN